MAITRIFAVGLCLLTLGQTALARETRPQDLFSVTFPTPRDGWACGRWGTILHTEDAGRTWQNQQSGSDETLSSICFTDARHGWVVGALGTIMHTKDGGRTWEKQKSPVNHYLMSVFFIDPEKGWAVGEQTHILHTQDGGQTWEVQFSDTEYILKSVSFCDPMNGWAVGEYGYIYHTADGGKTWDHQAGNFSINEYGDFSGEPYLFSVKALDPSTAWAVGIGGVIKQTTDGGVTWQRLEANLPNLHLFGIEIDNLGRRILIAADTAILMSVDGGKHFETVRTEPSLTNGWVYGIARMTKDQFIAVGNDGWIYKNHDVSKTSVWQRMTYLKNSLNSEEEE
ncbi:MAG: hypothetical protein KJP07_22185 [Desulfatitalea sp.]|nr:hypothetical protein [Desulfatitalea sp.]